MHHNPRQVSQLELVKDALIALFLTPFVMLILALIIYYSDWIDKILE